MPPEIEPKVDDIFDEPVSQGFDQVQTLKDMVNHHREGRMEDANNCFSQIVSNKTADLLSNWYHLSGNLKSHLANRVTTPQK